MIQYIKIHHYIISMRRYERNTTVWTKTHVTYVTYTTNIVEALVNGKNHQIQGLKKQLNSTSLEIIAKNLKTYNKLNLKNNVYTYWLCLIEFNLC